MVLNIFLAILTSVFFVGVSAGFLILCDKLRQPTEHNHPARKKKTATNELAPVVESNKKRFIIVSSITFLITFVIVFILTNIIYLLPYFYQPTKPRTTNVGPILNYQSSRRVIDNLSKNTQDFGYVNFCLLIPLGISLFVSTVFTISEYVQSSKKSGKKDNSD